MHDLVFYLIFLTYWSFIPVYCAQNDQNNVQFPDFKLKDPIFDYQVAEALNFRSLKVDSLIYDFKITFDVMTTVFEFLFDPEDTENFLKITSIMKVSKSFHSAAQFYMSKLLVTIKCNEKENLSILSALCLVFGGKKFQTTFSGLKNRPINLKDLIEIGHSANYKSTNVQIRQALNHLSSFAHHPHSFAFSELGHFHTENDYIWINRAVDRVFCFNQLPYSAEMYFLSGVFDQRTFFEGICEIKNNPQLLNIFLDRFFKISTLTCLQMIQFSIEKGNVQILEKIVEISPSDIFESPLNDFLANLINRSLFSFPLLQLSLNNKFSMDMALLASLKRKNLEIFKIILNHYIFNDLKWLGCKYLLSREDDNDLYYNHNYFVVEFFKSGVDTQIFPLLMPIFDLGQAHFKEIFKKLIRLEEFDFSEPQPIENSLIFHCILSKENYLELLPEDSTHLYLGPGGKKAHVRDFTVLEPFKIKQLLSRTARNPVDLLYFVDKLDDIKVVSELLPLFDINKIISITLEDIALTPIIPNSFSILKSAMEWTLLQLAIVYRKIALIELIVKDKRFDRNQMEFKVANRWTAPQLADEIIRFDSESPYRFSIAHELEEVSELFKL